MSLVLERGYNTMIFRSTGRSDCKYYYMRVLRAIGSSPVTVADVSLKGIMLLLWREKGMECSLWLTCCLKAETSQTGKAEDAKPRSQ